MARPKCFTNCWSTGTFSLTHMPLEFTENGPRKRNIHWMAEWKYLVDVRGQRSEWADCLETVEKATANKMTTANNSSIQTSFLSLICLHYGQCCTIIHLTCYSFHSLSSSGTVGLNVQNMLQWNEHHTVQKMSIWMCTQHILQQVAWL